MNHNKCTMMSLAFGVIRETKLNEKANEQVNKGKEAANKAIDKGVSDVKGKLGL